MLRRPGPVWLPLTLGLGWLLCRLLAGAQPLLLDLERPAAATLGGKASRGVGRLDDDDEGVDEVYLAAMAGLAAADADQGRVLEPAKEVAYELDRSHEIYLLEDKDYPTSVFQSYPGVGQASGVAALPSGLVVLFHRAGRAWTNTTFLANFSVAAASEQPGPPEARLLANDTIMLLDGENGAALATLGANQFYLPHSVASDPQGNLWVSDVGRHQVMRLPIGGGRRLAPGRRLWPDIVLGRAFEPGQDDKHFCQPSEIAVSSDGRLVFVADGYCNSRVMVFTGSGTFVTSFGQQQNMQVVHSITLIERRNLLCVADRERARLLCFRAGLDGDLGRLGELELELDYPLGRIFAIAALTDDHLLVSSSNKNNSNHFDLAALNPFTRELKQIWTSSDLLVPHSLARTWDGRHAYAADMSPNAYKKLFKFDIVTRQQSEHQQ